MFVTDVQPKSSRSSPDEECDPPSPGEGQLNCMLTLKDLEDIPSVSPSLIGEPVQTKVKNDRQTADNSCCPQSQMDSHSDAEC